MFVAIIAGAVSGILGLEGLVGFVTFFISSLLLSLGMYLKMNSDPRPFFKKSGDVWTEGIGQAMMVRPHRVACASHHCRDARAHASPQHRVCLPQSYVLFWTLFYDIVHIY